MILEKFDITASIVLYKEDKMELKNTIKCFLDTPLSKKLFLIDNNTDNNFKDFIEDKNIEYISVGKNIGFGSGHNLIIEKIKNTSNFHLILNPDVDFKLNVIPNLITKLKRHELVAMIAPKVVFPNGIHQFSCRRYPKAVELLARRFSLLRPLFKHTINRGIYSDKNLQSSFFAEYITGCFHLYKTADFVKLNGFDNRYFLYMEDVDICKKIEKIDKLKLYYPREEITHVLKQGSSKSIKLFFRHTSSAIKYFLKWGF